MRPKRPRNKRILLVVHSYYLRDTRPRRHAEALVEAGYDVDVLCCRDKDEPATETHRGVNIIRIPARRERGGKLRYVFEYASFIAVAALAVSRLHLKKHYRLIWILSIPNAMVFSGIVPRLLGVPVVIDVRDPMPEFFQSKYGLSPNSTLYRALLAEERISLRFASFVVTVHQPLLDALYRTGINPERSAVIMNAPDLSLLHASESSRDPEDRTVLYAGTIAQRYGVDIALAAVAALQNEIPTISLRLVGDGDFLPELRAMARSLGVEDRVSFDPPVPLTEVSGIIARSWCGVQPHRVDDLMKFSVSTKVLEWCALGLPVVVSRTKALEHFFSPDELTFIEPANIDDLCAKLLEIHKDPAAAAEKAERARKAVLRAYDWDNEKRALRELVARL